MPDEDEMIPSSALNGLAMKVISVIEDEEIVKKIHKHIDLWDRKERPPPKAIGPPKVREYSIDYSISQLPFFPDLASNETGSESDKRLAEGHDFSVIDPEYPETYSS